METLDWSECHDQILLTSLAVRFHLGFLFQSDTLTTLKLNYGHEMYAIDIIM